MSLSRYLKSLIPSAASTKGPLLAFYISSLCLFLLFYDYPILVAERYRGGVRLPFYLCSKFPLKLGFQFIGSLYLNQCRTGQDLKQLQADTQYLEDSNHTTSHLDIEAPIAYLRTHQKPIETAMHFSEDYTKLKRIIASLSTELKLILYRDIIP